jgi:hypothetical protein
MTPEQKLEVFGAMPRGGFTGEHYLRMTEGMTKDITSVEPAAVVNDKALP